MVGFLAAAVALAPVISKGIEALTNKRGKNREEKAEKQAECPHDRYEGGGGGSCHHQNNSNNQQVTAMADEVKIQGSPNAIARMLQKLGINLGNNEQVVSNSRNYQPNNYNNTPSSLPISGDSRVINLVIG